MIIIGKPKYKTTITRKLKDEARDFFKEYENNKTRSRYTNNYYQYIAYCRSQFSCKSKEECDEHIQDYEKHLESQGYSASTIHNRLVPVCIYHDIDLTTIDKPKRVTSQYKRGRTGNAAISSNSDINNPRYARSVEFQKRVGIRRNELKHLMGDDLVVDESGYTCVRVKKGKGGKMQLQRILPSDIGFIKTYFVDKESNDLVFENKEISSNNVSYHTLRAKQAQRAYCYYLNRLNDKGYREQLIHEIQQRASAYRRDGKTGKPILLSDKELTGYYWLRGDNKQFAINNNLPVKYDRLAVMAVSIFHLSHWRADVTIASYLLVE